MTGARESAADAGVPAPAAVILAGGRAERMGGRQKALVDVGGRAILDRQLGVLAPRFSRIAVVLAPAAGAGGAGGVEADDSAPAAAGAGAHGVEGDDSAPFRARGLAVVRDRAGGLGPVAGLAAGLAWAAGASVFALACDMPFVVGALIDLVTLRARSERADLVLPVIDGRPQPLCALYSAGTAPVIEAALHARHLRAGLLADALAGAGLRVTRIDGEEIRTIDPALRSFINVNRPLTS